MAMAMDDSVTVSIGLLTNGVFKVSFLVSAEVRSCAWRSHKGEKGVGRLQ